MIVPGLRRTGERGTTALGFYTWHNLLTWPTSVCMLLKNEYLKKIQWKTLPANTFTNEIAYNSFHFSSSFVEMISKTTY